MGYAYGAADGEEPRSFLVSYLVIASMIISLLVFSQIHQLIPSLFFVKNWLRCYQKAEHNLVDNQGRTIWFSGPAGTLAPKSKKKRKSTLVSASYMADIQTATKDYPPTTRNKASPSETLEPRLEAAEPSKRTKKGGKRATVRVARQDTGTPAHASVAAVAAADTATSTVVMPGLRRSTRRTVN
jgi:hypothetical protein